MVGTPESSTSFAEALDLVDEGCRECPYPRNVIQNAIASGLDQSIVKAKVETFNSEAAGFCIGGAMIVDDEVLCSNVLVFPTSNRRVGED